MKNLILATIAIFGVSALFANEYQLKSPDGKVSLSLRVGENIVYSVDFNSTSVIEPSSISFNYKQAPPLGKDVEVISDKKETINEMWKPVLRRFETIKNNYNSLVLELKEIKFPERKLNIEFRVFNDGVAFSTVFQEQFTSHEYELIDENTHFNFAENYTCWAVNYGSYTTSQEVESFERKIGEITPEMVIGLPITIKVNENCFAAITEADIDNYAGMYLKIKPTK